MLQKTEELKLQLKKQQKAIDHYLTVGLQEAEELQRNAQVLYEQQETTATELIQSLTTAYSIRKNYLDALHEYHITLLEIELYTE